MLSFGFWTFYFSLKLKFWDLFQSRSHYYGVVLIIHNGLDGILCNCWADSLFVQYTLICVLDILLSRQHFCLLVSSLDCILYSFWCLFSNSSKWLMHSMIFVFVFHCSFGVLFSFGKYLFLTRWEERLFERL